MLQRAFDTGTKSLGSEHPHVETYIAKTLRPRGPGEDGSTKQDSIDVNLWGLRQSSGHRARGARNLHV